MKVAVITVSDRAYNGEYLDKSGPEIVKLLQQQCSGIEIETLIVPDEENQIYNALNQFINKDFIITTGGTGLSERDITPDVTRKFIDKELPGIAEVLRAQSYEETPNAMLSRGMAGLKNKTIVINFPGSVKAVSLCTKLIIPIMTHAIAMMRNESH